MLNFIIYASIKCRYLITGNLIQEFKITCRSIHVYTYYKIQWVPFNLIAVKQICWIFHIHVTLKYNYTCNCVLHVHKVTEIVVV